MRTIAHEAMKAKKSDEDTSEEFRVLFMSLLGDIAHMLLSRKVICIGVAALGAKAESHIY